MGRLVKVIDGVLHVAYERVAGPGYTIYVSDGVSAEGWTYYPDDLDPDDFAQPWKQPVGSEDSYPAGAVVSHNGSAWVSTTNYNVWEPCKRLGSVYRWSAYLDTAHWRT